MTRTRKKRSRRFSARRSSLILATGEPKALLNAGPITALRTGAAAAIGAKYLARKDAKTLTIVGCGELCPYLAAAALAAIPSLKTVYLTNPHRPEKAAERLAAVTAATDALLKACGHARTAAINAAADAASAVGESDIVFTATCAKAPVVKSAWVKPGTHVSCIGADLPGKQEVESAVLARAAVYGDDTAQCFAVGECELPHKEGVLPALAGELGEVILGEKAGRTSRWRQITRFRLHRHRPAGHRLRRSHSPKPAKSRDSARSAKYKPGNPRPGRIVRGEGFLQLQLFDAAFHTRDLRKNVKMNRKTAGNACGTMPDVYTI